MPLFPGWTPSAWRCHPGQHDLVRGNTCRTMMNGSVVPGRGEVTATFRGACQQDERSIQEVKEAPVCHRCSATKAPIWCVLLQNGRRRLGASFLVFVSDVAQLLWTWTSVSCLCLKKRKKKRKNRVGEITFPPPKHRCRFARWTVNTPLILTKFAIARHYCTFFFHTSETPLLCPSSGAPPPSGQNRPPAHRWRLFVLASDPPSMQVHTPAEATMAAAAMLLLWGRRDAESHITSSPTCMSRYLIHTGTYRGTVCLLTRRAEMKTPTSVRPVPVPPPHSRLIFIFSLFILPGKNSLWSE